MTEREKVMKQMLAMAPRCSVHFRAAPLHQGEAGARRCG